MNKPPECFTYMYVKSWQCVFVLYTYLLQQFFCFKHIRYFFIIKFNVFINLHYIIFYTFIFWWLLFEAVSVIELEQSISQFRNQALMNKNNRYVCIGNKCPCQYIHILLHTKFCITGKCMVVLKFLMTIIYRVYGWWLLWT